MAPSVAHSATTETNAGPEVSLRVESVRVNRSQNDMQSRYGGRYYADGQGVQLQLSLKLRDGSFLSATRDGLILDMFVDDTYQSLLTGTREMSYSGNAPVVSADGQSIVFSVSTQRPIAEGAERVFVRGKLEAHIVRGALKVESAKLDLSVGKDCDVGPFHTTLRSISETDHVSSRESMTLALGVEGNASRIAKVRALDGNGKVLCETRPNRYLDGSYAGASSTVTLSLRDVRKEAITVEYSYVDKVELARIPFEAQVDLGGAKAGPIEFFESGPSQKSNPRSGRQWPPPEPSRSGAQIPARRTAFVPPTVTNSLSLKLTNTAVDLFSLTVGKPSTADIKQARWNNTPSRGLYPSGFTLARLLVSVPEAAILNVPDEAVTVTRFTDDKAGQLATTLYRESGFAKASIIRKSPDWQQTLVNVPLTVSPTPGARECTIAGAVRLKVGRGVRTNTAEGIILRKYGEVEIGPFKIRINEMRQGAPEYLGGGDYPFVDTFMNFTGPIDRLQHVEIIDPNAQNPFLASRSADSEQVGGGPREPRDRASIHFRFIKAPEGPVQIRVHYFDSEEMVEIPFDVTTGVGL